MLLKALLSRCSVAFFFALAKGVFPQHDYVNSTGLSTTGDDSLRICEVTFYGNRSTRAEALHKVLGIDSGDAYDSTAVARAKLRLLQTGVFERVEIFSLRVAGCVRLQVVLIENPRVALSDIGGDFCLRYGKVADRFWQRVRGWVGLTFVNFRGIFERLSISVTLIEWRGISMGWYKPLCGTPWYAQVGIWVYDYPSLTVPIRMQAAILSLGGGRHIGAGLKAFASISLSAKNTHFVDSRNSWTLYFRNDDNSIDSSRFVYDQFNYTRQNVDYFESVAATGFNIDKRNSRYEPRSGFSFVFQCKANRLFPEQEVYRENKYFRDSAFYNKEELAILLQNHRTFDPLQRMQLLACGFLQFEALTLWYHRGLWNGAHFAYRLRLILRDREGGLLNRISAGGEATLRGFALGTVSNHDRANNLLAGSVEYRFTIAQTPPFDMMCGLDLNAIGYDLRGFYYRFDGAFFFDAALVFDRWDRPLQPADGHQKAFSTGPALRLAMPTVRQVIAFDMASLTYLEGENLFSWAWPWERWNLYLGLYF